MAKRAGFKILDCQFNDVNGGSFSLMGAKEASPYRANDSLVQKILAAEENQGLGTLAPYAAFRDRVHRHRIDLQRAVQDINRSGRKIFAYGASTKGNVILQFCQFTDADIACAAEINEDKFGHYTPGTLIPIVPEGEARRKKPDYFLVMPWHFRDTLIEKEAAYLAAGGNLLFPLPKIEIVGRQSGYPTR